MYPQCDVGFCVSRNPVCKSSNRTRPPSYLCLRTAEHFLVGHRGDQAEAVTLGGLDVHDGRSEEPKPFPPDTRGQSATGCRDGLQRRWGWRWRWWWRGRGKSGGSEERCLPQGDRREGNNRWSLTGNRSVFSGTRGSSPVVNRFLFLCYTSSRSTHNLLTHIPRLSIRISCCNTCKLRDKIQRSVCGALNIRCWSRCRRSALQQPEANWRNFPEDFGCGELKMSFSLF